VGVVLLTTIACNSMSVSSNKFSVLYKTKVCNSYSQKKKLHQQKVFETPKRYVGLFLLFNDQLADAKCSVLQLPSRC
jgi:hypothetical protein